VPLTPTGKKVLASYKRQYGEKRGEEYFYASINIGKAGSEKWHGKSAKKKKKKR